MSKQWEEPGSRLRLKNAPGSVSTDSPSVFKRPVITIGGQIKMDFRWRFIGWKQTWACCFLAFITHHASSATRSEIEKNKNECEKALVQLFYKSTKSWRKKKKKKEAHSSLIIDALAKLTRQVRNPGYNLRDKYFIGNICLYILLPVCFEVVTNERQTESKWTSRRGSGTKM